MEVVGAKGTHKGEKRDRKQLSLSGETSTFPLLTAATDTHNDPEGKGKLKTLVTATAISHFHSATGMLLFP